MVTESGPDPAREFWRAPGLHSTRGAAGGALRLHRWIGSANDDVTDRSESMPHNPAIELRDPGGSLLSGYCDSYLNDSWILVR